MSVGTLMRHVFISYVRENSIIVDKLCIELQKRGITVWLDRKNILPGMYWKDAIRRAISDGDYFIACFSLEYNNQFRTYMNEEILLAIDELRLHQLNQTWFIPVLFSGTVPDISIGPEKTLLDIQHIDLNEQNWDKGIEQIEQSIRQNEETIHSELFSHEMNPESISFYSEFLQGRNTISKQRTEYIRNALSHKWPLLGLCSQFRDETKDILLSCMLDNNFESWERCVSLYLCLGNGFPIKEAEELNINLHKLHRFADRALVQHLNLIGASINDLIPNPFDNLPIYLEYFEHLAGDSSQGLSFLEGLLDHKDNQLRRAAVSQLKYFRFRKSVDLLKKIVEDTDIGVFYEGLNSLAHLVSYGDTDWIFNLIFEPLLELPILGYPYMDSQYERGSVLNVGKPRYDYLWLSIIDQDMQHMNEYRSKILLLEGILGGKSDLVTLINDYIRFLQLEDDRSRSNYFESMQLLDEKLFADQIYYPIYKNTIIWNRWWHPNSIGNELYPLLAREYYNNLS